MEIKNYNNHVYIKISKDDSNFLKDIRQNSFEKQNLVIDLKQANYTEKEILSLRNFISSQKNKGFCTIFICQNINYELFDEELFNIVPTYLEAKDVLEMEAIKKDLGF